MNFHWFFPSFVYPRKKNEETKKKLFILFRDEKFLLSAFRWFGIIFVQIIRDIEYSSILGDVFFARIKCAWVDTNFYNLCVRNFLFLEIRRRQYSDKRFHARTQEISTANMTLLIYSGSGCSPCWSFLFFLSLLLNLLIYASLPLLPFFAWFSWYVQLLSLALTYWLNSIKLLCFWCRF